MESVKERSLKLHEENKGKLSVNVKMDVRSKDDLALVYTPGVAEVSSAIDTDKNKVYDYTIKGNTVAVVSDGTRVLGLGDIGPEAALPVMEGKCLLFKKLANVDAFPICLATKDEDEIVSIVKNIAPVFGGINLEDISSPKVFNIEQRLKKGLDIPVFHDDNHGTGIVIMGAFINAIKLVNKDVSQIKLVVNGAGSAGISAVRMAANMGVSEIIVCDSKGAIYEGREDIKGTYKEEIAKKTNRKKTSGSLSEVVENADVLIGLSAPNVFKPEMIKSMAHDAVVFALANPTPEIMPAEAKRAGARIVATGRSDFPNQVNNALAFPGIFRGALDVRAREINDEMENAAADAIASIIKDPSYDKILPDVLDCRIAPAIAKAVAYAAIKTGVARVEMDPEEIEKQAIKMVC
ncbi:MAG: NADP-dependent malic enzyme [Candidatus Aenigmarchaeota archaeon]|nr:NADP-dependent malic enzyme [Candidatus Aenigmarchaeota archaeon]